MPARLRKSRFHDEKGNLAGVGGLANFPRALCSAVLRKAFNRIPELPWISYQAAAELARLARPEWSVLEFGAGMSTIWWAQRVRRVVSIESDPHWCKRVQENLDRRGLANVELRLREDVLQYPGLLEGDRGTYDLVMVDGLVRDRCAESALAGVRPAGYIYLDNADKHSTPEGGETRRAERVLLNAAAELGAAQRYFVDFAPAQAFVNQGLLISFR